MTPKRGHRLVEFDLDAEYRKHFEQLQTLIGKPVPLSRAYTQGDQPTLVSIEGDTATIRFRNGARLVGVPLRDLVNDAGYWRS